jgi:hypothetical protein
MPWVSIMGVSSKGGDKLIVISKERSVIGAWGGSWTQIGQVRCKNNHYGGGVTISPRNLRVGGSQRRLRMATGPGRREFAHTHAHAHAYPYPWVLGGHGWAWVLCIPTSNSKSESNFSDAVNMLTKKRFELKPRQWTTFYLSDPTKTWCRWVIHITQFWYMGAIWIAWVAWVCTYHAMGGHGWAHVMLWVGIGRCWWVCFGYGYKFKGKCWALLHSTPLYQLESSMLV